MKRSEKKYCCLTDHVQFPTALLGAMSPTETYVYVLLLDRAAAVPLSATGKPEEEAVIRFPVKELAEALDRSGPCVKAALRSLEERKLISRERQGGGRPALIRVRRSPVLRAPGASAADVRGKGRVSWSRA